MLKRPRPLEDSQNYDASAAPLAAEATEAVLPPAASSEPPKPKKKKKAKEKAKALPNISPLMAPPLRDASLLTVAECARIHLALWSADGTLTSIASDWGAGGVLPVKTYEYE